jgi:hypothetical protein
MKATAHEHQKDDSSAAAPARETGSGGGGGGRFGGVLSLQRQAGNRAVCGLLRGGGGPGADAAAGDPVAAPVREYLGRSAGGGAPLPRSVRTALEPSFGQGLDGIRVHADAAAARAAAALGARAFTVGRGIWFGAGQYRPERHAGGFLLAHEVAHALEQPAAFDPAAVRLGGTADAAEARADRAGEAAVRRRRAPVPGRSGPAIRRQPVTAPDRDRAVTVEHEGTRYRVVRQCAVVEDERRTPTTLPPRVGVGSDQQDVWLQVSWCTDTRGQVRTGADIPAAVLRVAEQLLGAATSGRAVSDVLSEATLRPFVDFIVAQSGGVVVEGSVRITVGGSGVTAGTGSLSVRTGPVSVGVGVTGDSTGGITIIPTLTFTPGGSTPRFTCPRGQQRETRLTRRCWYECTRQAPPAEPPPRPAPVREERRVSLYYQYATAMLNPTLSTSEQARLRTLVGEGFRPTAIEAWTSPEGPLRRGARFEGNQSLSRNRATQAHGEAQTACPATTAGCETVPGIQTTPRGERFGATEVAGQVVNERVGDDLARDAVARFRADPGEMERLTPADRLALDRATTPRAQAAIIYPYLRRADITLVRVVQPAAAPPTTPILTTRLPLDYFYCPPQVIERARPQLEPAGPRRTQP